MTKSIKLVLLVLFFPFALIGAILAGIGWACTVGFDGADKFLEKLK